MTVQELIDKLNKIENKEAYVYACEDEDCCETVFSIDYFDFDENSNIIFHQKN